jgi:hypothetical protein
MLYHRSHPHHKKRNFSEVGHYAVGTANLIPTTTLNTRFHSDEWSSASQKPLLYAKGGEVVDHDMGDGHRRTLQQVDRLDYSTYVR